MCIRQQVICYIVLMEPCGVSPTAARPEDPLPWMADFNSIHGIYSNNQRSEQERGFICIQGRSHLTSQTVKGDVDFR